jgi:Icc protein
MGQCEIATMIVAQITDFHVSLPGSKMDERYRTTDHLARAVDHINDLRPLPDVVLCTGDLVEGGSIEEYCRLKPILDNLSPEYLLIPGNHDDRRNMAAVFTEHGYMPRDGGFVQYAKDFGPLRLIALDTKIDGKPHGELCAERLAWLEDTLEQGRDRITLIFMHHPPFVSGLHRMDGMGFRNPGALDDIVSRHPQIERILAGHLHRPVTRRFAGTLVSTAPGTAHQIALDLVSQDRIDTVMEPPAVAMHVLLPDGGGLVSHMSYIGDFGRANIIPGKP